MIPTSCPTCKSEKTKEEKPEGGYMRHQRGYQFRKCQDCGTGFWINMKVGG